MGNVRRRLSSEIQQLTKTESLLFNDELGHHIVLNASVKVCQDLIQFDLKPILKHERLFRIEDQIPQDFPPPCPKFAVVKD